MFRPPPDYPWRFSRQKYEQKFRRKAPQWALTLDRDFGRSLFEVCCRIGFKLHPDVLTLGELFNGTGSVWDEKPCYRLDLQARPTPLPKQNNS